MVTISDVAAHAAVSPSTVSYVLSGKRPISAETCRRVEASIRKLGYHPHAGARALASSRTSVLALVIPLRTDLNVPVILQFVGAAAITARQYDHDVLLLTKDEGPEGLRRVADSAIADALIVMDVESTEPRLPVLQAIDRPVVLIGLPDPAPNLTCVDLDFTAAAATCVAHLAELGHAEIALVGPSPEVCKRGTSFAGRFLDGFDDASARRGIRTVSRCCSPTYDGTRACLDEIFDEQPGTTGLIVHNEAILAALLSELAQRNVRVPADLSVVAIGPENMMESHPVALTSITLPASEIGAMAVDLAMRRLAGHGEAEIRLLPPRLVERGSTAPARQRSRTSVVAAPRSRA